MTIDKYIEEYQKQIRLLLSQTRVSFLIGAGCSKCAGLPLMKELTEKICTDLRTEKTADKNQKKAISLLKKIILRYKDLENVSIEDFLSEIQDINSILERQIVKGISDPSYYEGKETFKKIHVEILQTKIKKKIADILGAGVSTIEIHRNFCRGVHYNLKKGRERTIHPVNYFILNYDTLIEDALALEKIVFTDGFIGGSTGWWEPSLFGSGTILEKKRNLEARVFKLHGSIDWVKPEGVNFPIRVRSSLPIKQIVGNGEPVVIYPASSKYIETQHDPFSQMIGSFRQYITKTENHVLAVMGYGFNDEHINLEIENGIKLSEGKLSLIIFLGLEDLPKTLTRWIEDNSINRQIMVLGKHGVWKEGRKIMHSEKELEWYKFENITQIINEVR